MPTLTDQIHTVTQALVDLLIADWDKYAATKDDIFYGDQAKYARFPSIAVESAPVERTLNQTGLQQRIGFTMYVLIFHGGLRDAQERRKMADETAEKVVVQLQSDRQLGGLIIHGHVTNLEPGYTSRGGQLLVTHRATWEGISNYTMERP